MRDFIPETGSMDEWNAAYYRLEDYLRAHLVTNKLHQSQIIMRLLRRAAAKHAVDPSQNPTTLALQEAYDEIDVWFRMQLPNPDIPASRLCTLGKVSMQVIDATDKWPTAFLSTDTPHEFRCAMEAASVQSGPDLCVSSMVPRPLDDDPGLEAVTVSEPPTRMVWLGLFVGTAGLVALGFFWFFK